MIRRLTIDHRPTNKDEAAAVRARGGMILFIGGPPRVNGMIAITRALGDRELHDALTCEPDVSPVPMEFGSDDVLVLACDGLWDSVSFVIIPQHPYLFLFVMFSYFVCV